MSPNMAASRAFYGEFLGFNLVMDLGWIATYASPSNPPRRYASRPGEALDGEQMRPT